MRWLALAIALLLCTGSAHAQQFVASSITASLVPSRTSNCVAPCAIFFDATGTKDSTTIYPFHELFYGWNFGDPGAGTWAYGSNTSKNAAIGATAAHVYDTPGTYTVALVVGNASGVVIKASTIIVADPAVTFATTQTTCISSSGTPVQGVGGCPANAAVANQVDWPTILATYSGQNKRALLLCSDTFTTASTSNPFPVSGPALGPWTIGAYGSGCVGTNIQYSGVSNAANSVLLTIGANSGDGRIVGLSWDGNTHPFGLASVGGGSTNILFENVSTNGTLWTGLGVSNPTNPVDGIFLAGSTITNLVPAVVGNQTPNAGCGAAWFANGVKHFALLGNNFDMGAACNSATGGQQAYDVRFQSWKLGAISNNFFTNPPLSKNTLDIHGPTPTADASLNPSQYLVISDSLIKAVGSSPNLYINPQNITSNEPIQDVVVDGNVLSSGSLSIYDMRIEAQNITVRNNIFDLSARSGAASCYGVNIIWGSQAQGQPKPGNLWFYNNAMDGENCTATGSNFANFSDAVGATTFKNILMWTPSSASSAIFNSVGQDAPTVCASCNSSAAQISSVTSPFAAGTPTPATPSTYAPTGYAVAGNGTSVPDFYDFFRKPYATWPIGAIR